jgi:hypothetical protein
MHRNSLRERYEKKRKERQDILGSGSLMEPTEDKKPFLVEEGLTQQCFPVLQSFTQVSFRY